MNLTTKTIFAFTLGLGLTFQISAGNLDDSTKPTYSCGEIQQEKLRACMITEQQAVLNCTANPDKSKAYLTKSLNCADAAILERENCGQITENQFSLCLANEEQATRDRANEKALPKTPTALKECMDGHARILAPLFASRAELFNSDLLYVEQSRECLGIEIPRIPKTIGALI